MNSFADRVRETTTTTGTGDITLDGAVTQFLAFQDAFSVNDVVSYVIAGQSGSEWEVGTGTLIGATTLQRDTVVASSNSGNLVNFSAGTKDVFATFTAADIADILTEIAGKADTVHTHAISDTTGLQDALDDKADTASLAASATTDTTNASNISSGTLDDARLSSNVAMENATNDFSAAQEISVNGAASTPALRIDGTIFTGGTGSTTTPQLLVEPTGTTSSSWSTSGTLIGGNGPSGYGGNLIHLLVNNVSRFYVNSNGDAVAANFYTSGIAGVIGISNDVSFRRHAANAFQMGADAASPSAQTFKGPDATGTNGVGGIMNIAAGQSTGNATTAELRLQTSEPTSSGSTAQTLTTRLTISGTAITAALPIVTQGYTVAGLAAITPLVAGMRAHVTDATGPTFMATLVGGGSVVAPAFYDGTNWICA